MSTSLHAARVTADLQGHRTLKKVIHILAHIYELQRHQDPRVSQAFVAAAYKAALSAAAANGSWDLSWDLLGLPDPDRSSTPLYTAAETVAVVAMAKERKVMDEMLAKAKASKGAAAAGKKEDP